MKDDDKFLFRRKARVHACAYCDELFPENKMRCPSCHQWNTVEKQIIGNDGTVLLSEIEENALDYLPTGPWDECFGTNYKTGKSGIVNTSVTLLGGAPGAGKSTLALQLANALSKKQKREILYITGEMAPAELLTYALRLGIKDVSKIRVYPMSSNTELSLVFKARKPCAVIVDSLPEIVPDHNQATEFCRRFKPYAVELKSPVIIIDHVTKDLDFAGMMQLQHVVDTLILFSVFGPEAEQLREMSSVKNRFGPLATTLLKLQENGLVHYEAEDE